MSILYNMTRVRTLRKGCKLIDSIKNNFLIKSHKMYYEKDYIEVINDAKEITDIIVNYPDDCWKKFEKPKADQRQTVFTQGRFKGYIPCFYLDNCLDKTVKLRDKKGIIEMIITYHDDLLEYSQSLKISSIYINGLYVGLNEEGKVIELWSCNHKKTYIQAMLDQMRTLKDKTIGYISREKTLLNTDLSKRT